MQQFNNDTKSLFSYSFHILLVLRLDYKFDGKHIEWQYLEVVRKAIAAGFFANACRLEPYSYNGMYKTVRTSQEVYVHPSSVLFRVNPKWVIYNSLVSTDRQYMRNVISIDPSWLREAAPHFYQHQQPNPIAH
ncbi:unnamed protein product [Coffea canephora]|uniref:DEAD-box helicase OB fold domain-containing protein n=1 Tax=Coffea canephora TaxID=49390 RepID=A0A068TKF5_COFCA|nr:unnamed protein product [Coffea canephora]